MADARYLDGLKRVSSPLVFVGKQRVFGLPAFRET
jgi:hypothetical protein